MEISLDMREWLVILFVIAIALTVLDGLRRSWRQRRRNSVRLKVDKNIPPPLGEHEEVDPQISSELPGGGARVVTRDKTARPSMEAAGAEEDGGSARNFSTEHAPWRGRGDRDESTRGERAATWRSAAARLRESDKDEQHGSTGREPAWEADGGQDSPAETGKTQHQGTLDLEETLEEQTARTDEREEEIIIINVMAKAGRKLLGGDLLPVLSRQGMRLGDMSIFHRYADLHGKGPVMFSMANMLKPGTFDISEIEEFATTGVSFFMHLPNPLGNMHCFERMLETARALRDALDAELKDERRSVFTPQTIEHCRQKIRDFELALLTGR